MADTRTQPHPGAEQVYLFPIIAVLLGALAALLTWQATSLHGIGFSPDSTGYIRLARDMVHNGLAFLGRDEAVAQPPLYPATLALLARVTGVDPLAAARWLNIAIAAGLVITLLLAARRVTRAAPALLAAGLLTCFSSPLQHVLAMAWTEPLFILTVIILFLLLSGERTTLPVALLAGLLTAAACLGRYAGIVLIPLVCLFIQIAWPGTLARRLRGVAFFALPPTLLLGLYLVRNVAVSGTLLGPRDPARLGLAANTALAFNTVLGWIMPAPLAASRMVMLGILLLLLAAGWFSRRQLLRAARCAHPITWLAGAFIPAYLAFIIWTSTTTAYDPIDSRLLSPVYPLLLLIALPALQAIFRRQHSVWRHAAVVGLAAWFLVVPCRRVVSAANLKAQQGAGGYNVLTWQESPMVDHFRQSGQPRQEALFSNAPDALYILADVEAAISPARRGYNSQETTGITAENLFQVLPELDGSLLAWFSGQERAYLFGPDDLALMCSLEVIQQFDDGTLYRLGRQAPAPG